MSRKIRIGSVQLNRDLLNAPKEKCTANIDIACKWLEEAGVAGCDIVCLPEMLNCYGLPSEMHLDAAVDLSGPEVQRMSCLAEKHNMYAIIGLLMKEEDHNRNAAIILGRDGQCCGQFNKVHVCPMEPWWNRVEEGDSWPVFEVDFGKIGIMICYDNHFPESARILALNGAEIIFYPLMGEEQGEVVWEIMARSRAIDNRVFVVPCTGMGGARCMIIDPEGYIIADTGGKEGIAVAEVDLDMPRMPMDSFRHYFGKSSNRKLAYLVSRRVDTYSSLLEKTRLTWEDSIIGSP